MYLKRVELHGFKSFADKTVIEFMPGVTGIVGPNGCGKSNITDAIRWVLGEKSAKAMRGDTMSDVIFSGSEDRKAQNVAEVTLVFDNEDHYLSIDANEVEITRRLYRQGSEGEYFINRRQVRMKDITELIMDTGLSRGSLSIISQNSISEFVASKPEDRRAIFEEAAGVSKYKKRKRETVSKLERTTANLERVEDIVNELERQIGPLKRQKEKAETYLSLSESLKSIEISVLVKEIETLSDELEDLNKRIEKSEADKTALETDILVNENQVEDQRVKMLALDKEINDLQGELLQIMNTVNTLETQRVEIDTNRKHMMENYDPEDIAARIKAMKEILRDAVTEYNDRAKRYNESKKEKDDLILKQQENEKNRTKMRNDIERLNIVLHQDRAQREILVDAIENKSDYNMGVRAVLKAKDSLSGIKGVLGDLLEAQDGYENALSTALGAAVQFVVTQTDEQAKEAIRFLRNNRAGRVTFLPVETLKPRYLREDAAFTVRSMPGYLGIMSDFVTYDKRLKSIVLNQLGQVVVSDTLDHATEIANNLYHRYRVVTLQGDVINVGGSLTGGRYKTQKSAFMNKKELERLKVKIKEEEKNLNTMKSALNKAEDEGRELSQILMEKQMSLAKLEMIATKKRNDYEIAKKEYEELTNENVKMEEVVSGEATNELLEELNEAMRKRDELNENIQAKRAIRMGYVNENDERQILLKSLRKELKAIESNLTDIKVKKTQTDSECSNYLMRLNDAYGLTYEHATELTDVTIHVASAKEEVIRLRHEINSLGHVNLDSIEEYNEVNERYETLNTSRMELLNAQDSLLKAISEMDEIMLDRFSKTFAAVNREFNDVFRYLFGGGHASLKYVDPENILETGIDIIAQPPGKATKLHSFSGGENALIALSCLFAILRVRPVPMCILDEVEAALDLANVERFAKYLRDFSEKTQFIVVTHREGTMAECDLLYGATMQQKGVTKLVSVQLKEAAHMAEAD